MIKSVTLETFLNGKYEDYDGYRAINLPWHSSMCKPLCVDPSEVKSQFERGVGSDYEIENLVPLAQFYEINSIEQIDDIWAFIVARVLQNGTEEILLWTDEGPTSLEQSLKEFLDGLLAPDDPKWVMNNEQ